SATNANDADDIVAVGVAAEATAPIFTSFCPTAVGTFSAPPNVQPNPAIGITVYAPGNWVVYCFGLYYVAGAHAFFLDNGETFADGSLALYGFF
ncbi:MAG: hypothetical protein SV422_11480, partial [Pseudomonadota bacterium]|nr:hypothetical protein [Pseudomonadota bacterium]